MDDIARGTILGLRRVGYEIINLGSDRPHELLHVVQLIKKETRKKAKLVFGPEAKADVRATWANVEKARELLGWQPEVSLEEGVHRLVAWYMEHRELASGLAL